MAKRLLKGRTKIMVDRSGTPRIQEDIGDRVSVYTLAEWNKELEKRAKAAKNKDKMTETQEKKKESSKEGAPKRGRGRPKKIAEPSLPDLTDV